MKRVKTVLSLNAAESYKTLRDSTSKFDLQLARAIDRSIEILKTTPEYGDDIPKRLIPKQYLENGITNLWRIELPNFWRLLYTIQGDKIEIICFVLEWINHEEYNRLFGYKKK